MELSGFPCGLSGFQHSLLVALCTFSPFNPVPPNIGAGVKGFFPFKKKKKLSPVYQLYFLNHWIFFPK